MLRGDAAVATVDAAMATVDAAMAVTEGGIPQARVTVVLITVHGEDGHAAVHAGTLLLLLGVRVRVRVRD